MSFKESNTPAVGLSLRDEMPGCIGWGERKEGGGRGGGRMLSQDQNAIRATSRLFSKVKRPVSRLWIEANWLELRTFNSHKELEGLMVQYLLCSLIFSVLTESLAGSTKIRDLQNGQT